MGAHAEKRIEQRHACRGTMNWVYFNKECYGAARVLNFSQNGSSFETDQALGGGPRCLDSLMGGISSESVVCFFEKHQAASANG